MKTLIALVLPAAFFLSGCVAHVRPVDVEYGPAPLYVETAPYVVYEGYPTYYYEGRWYRRTPRGWGYLREEPYELRRRRPYVQQAPPAHRRDSRPVFPANPTPNRAPPAHRR